MKFSALKSEYLDCSVYGLLSEKICIWDPYIDSQEISEQTQLERFLNSLTQYDRFCILTLRSWTIRKSVQKSPIHDLTKILTGLLFFLPSFIMLKQSILAMLANLYVGRHVWVKNLNTEARKHRVDYSYSCLTHKINHQKTRMCHYSKTLKGVTFPYEA